MKARLRKVAREVRNIGTSARENERLFAGAGEEQVDDRGDAIFCVYQVDHMFDVAIRTSKRGALYVRGVVLHRIRK